MIWIIILCVKFKIYTLRQSCSSIQTILNPLCLGYRPNRGSHVGGGVGLKVLTCTPKLLIVGRPFDGHKFEGTRLVGAIR